MGEHHVRVDIGRYRYGKCQRNSKTEEMQKKAKTSEHKWYEHAQVSTSVRRYVLFKVEVIKAKFDKITMGQNRYNVLIESCR